MDAGTDDGMACCDTCPFTPTCEEMAEFMEQIALPQDSDDEDERCHWCRLVLVDGGYGIEGFDFCNESCANSWWEEWCRE